MHACEHWRNHPNSGSIIGGFVSHVVHCPTAMPKLGGLLVWTRRFTHLHTSYAVFSASAALQQQHMLPRLLRHKIWNKMCYKLRFLQCGAPVRLLSWHFAELTLFLHGSCDYNYGITMARWAACELLTVWSYPAWLPWLRSRFQTLLEAACVALFAARGFHLFPTCQAGVC